MICSYFERESEKYVLENWRISYVERIFKSLDISVGSFNTEDIFLDIGVGNTGYNGHRSCKTRSKGNWYRYISKGNT